ncbi:unnamed protein product [Effrenium voratum]|nr:unnamed protein product [Effrenium voratum]
MRGCFPGTNCLERFGAFSALLGPGLGFAGCDVCGSCVTLRPISGARDWEVCAISTQTKDHEFITAEVEVEYSVIPKHAKDAIYKLLQQDRQSLMRSFLITPIRTFLNKNTLEEVFGKKDEVTSVVKEQLTDFLRPYGFAVHGVQIRELQVSPEVMHAMNEAKKQRRARDVACTSKAEPVLACQGLDDEGVKQLAQECAQLVREAKCNPNELLRYFETAQIDRAIQATHAQPMPDMDGDMVQQLLDETAPSTSAAGMVFGGPSQHTMA